MVSAAIRASRPSPVFRESARPSRFAGQGRSDLFQTVRSRAACGQAGEGIGGAAVQEQQRQVGGLGAGKRAAHAFGFDGLGRVAQAGGVGEDHRIAAEIHPHLDHVAGGAGGFGHDGHVAAGKRIDQRAFAGVRRTDHC